MGRPHGRRQARLRGDRARHRGLRAGARWSPATASTPAGTSAAEVEVVELPIDDSWIRDSGPIFVGRRRRPGSASTSRFNGWGGKFPPYDARRRAARAAAASTSASPRDAGAVRARGRLDRRRRRGHADRPPSSACSHPEPQPGARPATRSRTALRRLPRRRADRLARPRAGRGRRHRRPRRQRRRLRRARPVLLQTVPTRTTRTTSDAPGEPAPRCARGRRSTWSSSTCCRSLEVRRPRAASCPTLNFYCATAP